MKIGRAARMFARRVPPAAERRRAIVALAKSRLASFVVAQTGEDTTVVFRDIGAPLIKEALSAVRVICDAWEMADAELQDALVSTPTSDWPAVRNVFNRMRRALEEVE